MEHKLNSTWRRIQNESNIKQLKKVKAPVEKEGLNNPKICDKTKSQKANGQKCVRKGVPKKNPEAVSSNGVAVKR